MIITEVPVYTSSLPSPVGPRADKVAPAVLEFPPVVRASELGIPATAVMAFLRGISIAAAAIMTIASETAKVMITHQD